MRGRRARELPGGPARSMSLRILSRLYLSLLLYDAEGMAGPLRDLPLEPKNMYTFFEEIVSAKYAREQISKPSIFFFLSRL